MSLLDAIDELNGSGRLDLIIQLPYSIKTETRRREADKRKKQIESQLENSRYGIAYIDATEKVTQLNRSLENNLLAQIQYLQKLFYNQIGVSETVFDGTAEESVMLNYYSRTIDPILETITAEFDRKFISDTARTQGQKIMYFRDPFKLATVEKLAEMADKFTRNEILSSNEIRGIVGYRPIEDPRADELRNKNLNESMDSPPPPSTRDAVGESSEEEQPNNNYSVMDIPIR